ncbi:hypothetical protein JCM10207_006286 [Rhodosporidiobolus poonsookiae]
MSFAPPKTPIASPRKPLTSSRPPSRAASPSKPSSSSSVNLPFPRPSSRASVADAPRPSSRASNVSLDGRASPTKRVSGLTASTNGRLSPTKPLRATTGSTSSLRGASTSSLASVRSSGRAGARGRGSDASTKFADESPVETETEAEGEDDSVPRRRAGFGSLSGRGKRGARLHEDTEDEEGFLAAHEETRRGSIVEMDETETEDQGSTEGASDEETETEEEEKDGKQQNVVVCLRVRPSKTLDPGAPSPIYSLSSSLSTLSLTASHPTLLKRGGKSSSSDEYEYRFDLLHIPPHPTTELYDRKIKPVVRAALGGFNGTVFAYGQTASGKTHTMMGSPQEPGIIPLAIDELFSYIHKQNTHRTYSLRVSFLEIYNEQLRDLLASPPATSASGSAPLKPPEIVDNGVVKNLEERAVSLPGQVLDVLREGEQRRRVGATDWNERSSRSHCVFVVTIESMPKSQTGAARTSRLNLIDLAGSESATGQEERRKEGAFINKSLLTLGTVIGKLTDPSTAASHIPYRDSKLTRLLQPALSGNSRVAVVCTVSPDPEQATETLSTLKFARRARNVVTKAERGVLMTDQMMLKSYAAQVEKLQLQIKAVESGEVLRERDLAAKRADEAERKGKEAQDALVAKELELSRLRDQLAHTQSLILTGPSLEATARRVSGAHHSAVDLPELLSPSRSRSISGMARGMVPGLGGGRRASEMSALGLGTPSRFGIGRVPTAGARLAEEDEVKEKEAALMRQLEEATAKLATLTTASSELETLRAQVSQLQRSSSLARLDAEKSAQANSDRRERIRALEAELGEVREKLRLAEEERGAVLEQLRQLRAELDELRTGREGDAEALQQRLSAAEQDKAAVVAVQEERVKGVEATLRAAQDAVRQKESLLVDLEATVQSLERRLAHQDTAAAQRADVRDETIASLEREVGSAKKELGEVSAAKEAAVQSALDQAADVRRECDVALKTMEETERRLHEVEELAELQRGQHAAAEQQTQREKDAAVAALQAEIERLVADLAAKEERIAQLQRTVERYERLEAQRTTFEKNQRSGTDMLKQRLADLQARTSTPVPQQLGRSASSASNTSAHSRASSSTADANVELQIRNAELASRIAELEKELQTPSRPSSRASGTREASPMDVKEKLELVGHVDSQTKRAEVAEEKAEDWRQKYLQAQRLLDQLMNRNSTENDPPPPTSTSSTTPRKASSSRRSPLNASQSPAPTARPPLGSPQLSYSSTWSKPTPPPLPYSPHQRERERTARRKTIAKDLEKLKETSAVAQRREGFDSPQASPVKGEFGARVRETKRSWEA